MCQVKISQQVNKKKISALNKLYYILLWWDLGHVRERSNSDNSYLLPGQKIFNVGIVSQNAESVFGIKRFIFWRILCSKLGESRFRIIVFLRHCKRPRKLMLNEAPYSCDADKIHSVWRPAWNICNPLARRGPSGGGVRGKGKLLARRLARVSC